MVLDKKHNKIHSNFNSADLTITMVKLALLFLVCDGPVCQTSPASVLCSSRRKKAVQVRLITPNRLRVSGHMYVSPPNSTQDFLYNFNLTELTCETYGSLSLYLLEWRIEFRSNKRHPFHLLSQRRIQNLSEGTPTYFSVTFYWQLHKTKKVGPRGRSVTCFLLLCGKGVCDPLNTGSKT